MTGVNAALELQELVVDVGRRLASPFARRQVDCAMNDHFDLVL